MDLPRAPIHLRQERAGIHAVAQELNRLGLLWRENPAPDVGIDGQIELVDEAGRATGELLAVQVKSGSSYFRDHGSEWRFHPEEKHRFYWERFPIPVLLFLHSPDDGSTYWADVRQALRTPSTASSAYVAVPKGNRLQDADVEHLFASTGASGRPFLPLDDVLSVMVTGTSSAPGFPVTYFDLFANGLTNIARSLYYGMDLAVEVAEQLLDSDMVEVGLGFGPREHDFLFGYVLFLVEQHLADVDVADCLIDWHDRQMQPQFIAPLTSRGRELVRRIHDLQQEMERDGRLQNPMRAEVAQEDWVRMQWTVSHRLRVPVIAEFRRLLRRSVEASGSG